ncbi:hypothetical protein WJX72_012148 [[Myrmecia] bisecta]|uniref:PAS domain-containing protein n=1 Tax=[Myrmecia] bisecta TaxID=41462 RepID=A0AAW1RAP3_9CHLO
METAHRPTNRAVGPANCLNLPQTCPAPQQSMEEVGFAEQFATHGQVRQITLSKHTLSGQGHALRAPSLTCAIRMLAACKDSLQRLRSSLLPGGPVAFAVLLTAMPNLRTLELQSAPVLGAFFQACQHVEEVTLHGDQSAHNVANSVLCDVGGRYPHLRRLEVHFNRVSARPHWWEKFVAGRDCAYSNECTFNEAAHWAGLGLAVIAHDTLRELELHASNPEGAETCGPEFVVAVHCPQLRSFTFCGGGASSDLSYFELACPCLADINISARGASAAFFAAMHVQPTNLQQLTVWEDRFYFLSLPGSTHHAKAARMRPAMEAAKANPFSYLASHPTQRQLTLQLERADMVHLSHQRMPALEILHLTLSGSPGKLSRRHLVQQQQDATWKRFSQHCPNLRDLTAKVALGDLQAFSHHSMPSLELLRLHAEALCDAVPTQSLELIQKQSAGMWQRFRQNCAQLRRVVVLVPAGSGGARRSGSFTSSGGSTFSGGSSDAGGSSGRSFLEEGGDTQGLLAKEASIQDGVFGVLYTLSKEKLSANWKFALAGILLDFIQTLVFIVGPGFPWNIDHNFWLYKILYSIQIQNPILTRGFTLYVAVFGILSGILVGSVALCVFVGYCFKAHRFPYVWPIKLLRLAVSIFFSLFFISSLNLFLAAVNCQDAPGQSTRVMRAFPAVVCWKMPHAILASFSIGMATIFFVVSFCMVMAQSELNPVSHDLLSSPHTIVELHGHVMKSMMCVIHSVLSDYQKLQAVLLLMLSAMIFWSQLRWAPHYISWVNHLRSALYCTLLWSSGMLTALTYAHSQDQRDQVTLVCKFENPRQVEICSRVMRAWHRDETLVEEKVALAELILKAGMDVFSSSAFIHIVYANFLIEARMNETAGYAQLAQASEKRAYQTYQDVLERYPKSIKLLRSYARFLEEVKNDPHAAQRVYREADKQEDLQQEAHQQNMHDDDTADVRNMRIDDSTDAVVVINSAGVIQLTNQVTNKMFGYKTDELNGKNVSCLMPAPFSHRHNAYVRNYMTTGTKRVLDVTREVVALHKERHVFPITLAVTKVQQANGETAFMGVIKKVEEDDSGGGSAWLMRMGADSSPVLCVNQGFSELLGYAPDDIITKQFTSIAANPAALGAIIKAAMAKGDVKERDSGESRVAEDEEGPDAAGDTEEHEVVLMHRYGGEVAVKMTFTASGTDAQRILVAKMVSATGQLPAVLAMDAKGALVYTNAQLRALLGYNMQSAAKLAFANLLPPELGPAHLELMRRARTNRSSLDGPDGREGLSCRNGRTVIMISAQGGEVPVRLKVSSFWRETEGQGRKQLFSAEVQPVSLQQLRDEQRMQMQIDLTYNLIMAVDDKSARAAFGYTPNQLVGRAFTSFVTSAPGETPVLRLVAGDIKRILFSQPASRGRITKVNEAAGLLLGRDPASLNGQPLQLLFPELPPDAHMDLLLAGGDKRSALRGSSKAVPTSRPVGTKTYTAMHADGATLGIKVVAVPKQRSTTRALLRLTLSRHGMAAAPTQAPLAATASNASNRSQPEAPDLISPDLMQLSGAFTVRPAQEPAERPTSLGGGAQLSGLPGSPVGRVKISQRHRSLSGAGPAYTALERSILGTEASATNATPPPPLPVEDPASCDDPSEPAALPQLEIPGAGDTGSPPSMDDEAGEGDSPRADSTGTQRTHDWLRSLPPSPTVAPRFTKGNSPRTPAFAGDGSPASARATPGMTGDADANEDDEDGALLAGQPDSSDANAIFDGSSSPAVGRGRSGGGCPVIHGGASPALFDFDSDANKAPPQRMGSLLHQGSLVDGTDDQSELSSADGPNAHGDFARAKRYKRILNLLLTNVSHAAITRLRSHIKTLAVLAAVAHLICASVVLSEITNHDRSVVTVLSATNCASYMMTICTDAREVGVAGEIQMMVPNISAAAVAAAIAPAHPPAETREYIFSAAESLETEQEFMHFHGSSKSSPGFLQLWDFPSTNLTFYQDVENPTYVHETMGLWEAGVNFLAAAREVAVAAGRPIIGNLSASPDWRFIVDNGPDVLGPAYAAAIDIEVVHAQSTKDTVMMVILMLLIFEAMAWTSGKFCYVWWMLQQVADERLALYSVFLIVPSAAVKKLASREIRLEADVSDSDDEEQVVQDRQVIEVHDDDEDENDVKHETTTLVPQRSVRVMHHEDGMARKSDAARPLLAAEGDVEAGTGRLIKATGHTSHTDIASAAHDMLSQQRASKSVTVTPREIPTKSTKWSGVKSLVKGMTSWFDVLSLAARASEAARQSRMYTTKLGLTRRLESNWRLGSLAVYKLLSPFVAIGTVTSIAYIIMYATMAKGDSLGRLGLAAQCVHRAERVRYFAAQLLIGSNAPTTTAADLEYYRDRLDNESHALYNTHLQLLYGPLDATVGTQIHLTAPQLDLFYTTSECLRANQATCYKPTHPFYQETNQGLDALMLAYYHKSQMLAKDARAALNPQNERFLFIWEAGGNDLHDALITSVSIWISAIVAQMGAYRTALIVLTIGLRIGWMIAVVIFFRPFLAATSRESNRVADLLSQLPAELDVESILEQANRSTEGGTKFDRMDSKPNVHVSKPALLPRLGGRRIAPAPAGLA